MTFVHSKDSRIMVGSNAISAFLTGISVSSTTEMADSTDLTATTKNYTPGLSDSTMSLSGLFEPTYDTAVRAVLDSASGVAVTAAPAGFAAGNRVFMVSARETSYEVGAAVGAVVSASVNVQGDGRSDIGVSLVDLAQVTATGNGSSVDGTASSSTGGLAVLHVSACSGSLVVKVQGSSTGSSGWSDLATFTTATGATSERVTLAGSIPRYLRASWTLTGTSAAATFTASLARR